MRQLGTYDYIGILPEHPDEDGYIDVGDIRLVCNEECVPALRMECDDILGESVLQQDLEEFYRLIEAEGPYEFEEVSLEKGDIVIDAGANMGVFSVFAATRGASRVYAFEPIELIHGILRQNIRANGHEETVAVVPAGLSDMTGLQTIFTSGEIGSVAGSSLVFAEQGQGVQAQFTTLDHWVKSNNIHRIDFIKADIEGAERKLLAGARETLKKFKPRLSICTYHLPDDPQVLEELIKEIEPEYHIIQRRKKLFAWCNR